MRMLRRCLGGQALQPVIPKTANGTVHLGNGRRMRMSSLAVGQMVPQAWLDGHVKCASTFNVVPRVPTT